MFESVLSQPAVIPYTRFFPQNVQKILSPILSRMGFSDAEKNYRAVYDLNGMFFVILELVWGDFMENVGRMADIIVDCVKSRFPGRTKESV